MAASLSTSAAPKFALEDIDEFSRIVADASGELTWMNGIAERHALSFALEGATGYTTGIGNFDRTERCLDELDAAGLRR